MTNAADASVTLHINEYIYIYIYNKLIYNKLIYK